MSTPKEPKRRYRLRDNGAIPNAPFAQSAIFKEVGGKTLKELNEEDGFVVFPPSCAESENIDEKSMLVWGNAECIKTGNLMGFVGCPGEELVIGTRFADEGSGDWLLHRMLAKALGFNAVDLKVGVDDANQRYQLLELMLPDYLARALRRGPYRTYIRRSFNDSHVRGAIDVPQYIREDIPFTEKVSYNTRDLLADNDVMQLVRHTVEVVFAPNARIARFGGARWDKSPELRGLVSAVREATPGYRPRDRRKVLAVNVRRLIRSRYYYAYRDLQRLCVAILCGRGISVMGERDKVHGIVFDGAWLWEEYLNCLFEEASLPVLHPRNRAGKGGQYLFTPNAGLIFPDFIGNAASRPVVMDAKYKPQGNVRGSDFHQILSYMFRFDADRGFFLYPAQSLEGSKEYSLLRGLSPRARKREGKGVLVTKLGLRIPQHCGDEATFSGLMDDYEREFIARLEKFLR